LRVVISVAGAKIWKEVDLDSIGPAQNLHLLNAQFHFILCSSRSQDNIASPEPAFMPIDSI
jgi:hypothetical protein